MKIKKSNLKRLASLSAVGDGAVGVTAGIAEASNVVYSGIGDREIGFSPGFERNGKITGPNGATAWFHADLYLGSSGAHGFNVDFAHGFQTGVKWSTAIPHHLSVKRGNIASAFQAVASGSYTVFNSTDKYLRFKFTGGKLGKPVCGWARLDVSFRGPDVTLVDYADDFSGNQIPAGDTGQTQEPPPTSLDEPCGALARGMRRVLVAKSASTGDTTYDTAGAQIPAGVTGTLDLSDSHGCPRPRGAPHQDNGPRREYCVREPRRCGRLGNLGGRV